MGYLGSIDGQNPFRNIATFILPHIYSDYCNLCSSLMRFLPDLIHHYEPIQCYAVIFIAIPPPPPPEK